MGENKISVIVPIYMVEEFLRKCVDSIINQTYKNLEIILVDDGSKDLCPQICDEYEKQDNRIKVIHKKNGGLSSARNAGIAAATGDYIAFVDADDWIDPDMYETAMNLAVEYDADIVSTDYRFWRPWKNYNKILDCDNKGTIKVYTNIEAIKELYFGPQRFDGIAVMVWNKIYRASILKKVQFFEGYIHEDCDFTPKALYYANKVVKINKSFYTYNIHRGSNSTTGMSVSTFKLRSSKVMTKSVADFFCEHYIEGVSEFTFKVYYNVLFDGYYNCYINRRRSKEFADDAKEYLKVLKEEKPNVLRINNNKRVRFFYFSPFLFCVATWAKRKKENIVYMMRVFFTGRN